MVSMSSPRSLPLVIAVQLLAGSPIVELAYQSLDRSMFPAVTHEG